MDRSQPGNNKLKIFCKLKIFVQEEKEKSLGGENSRIGIIKRNRKITTIKKRKQNEYEIYKAGNKI
jgi:hypothetical protein